MNKKYVKGFISAKIVKGKKGAKKKPNGSKGKSQDIETKKPD